MNIRRSFHAIAAITGLTAIAGAGVVAADSPAMVQQFEFRRNNANIYRRQSVPMCGTDTGASIPTRSQRRRRRRARWNKAR